MPAQNQPLLDFIDSAKSQGASDDFVVALLRQNGWSEKRIYQAFSAWYEARTGRAVPNGGGRIEAAKDAFLYLLAFITLGIWAIQLGALLFTVIDCVFPNSALDYPGANWVTGRIADELASIIVAFPIFLLVTRGIVRGVRQRPEHLESSVRKWLTYIALVITASTMIGDVVTFLAYFLRGDLDTRFVLKVLTVLVIAGGVLTYYLDSLHRDETSPSRTRWFAFAAVALVSFGLVAGFIQIGSPSMQRSRAEDARRRFDLSSIAWSLHRQWLAGNQRDLVLPATLRGLSGSNFSITDPVSGQAYRYTPVSGTTYRLCATFSHASPEGVPTQWRHSSGTACFDLDARENVDLIPRPW